jgi:DNA polymerase-3 subunit epsilon
LLLEAKLIKQLQPIHNQRLRRENDLCAWQMLPAPQGGYMVALKYAADIDFGRTDNLYGMFTSQRKAMQTLRDLAEAHRLCLIQLGIEKPSRGKAVPCFAYQLKKCQGVCVGKEDLLRHDLRLTEALARLKLNAWPHTGPIGIPEKHDGREEVHIVDRWSYLGTAREESEIAEILANGADAAFDLDTYKILAKHIKSRKILPLSPL